VEIKFPVIVGSNSKRDHMCNRDMIVTMANRDYSNSLSSFPFILI